MNNYGIDDMEFLAKTDRIKLNINQQYLLYR